MIANHDRIANQDRKDGNPTMDEAADDRDIGEEFDPDSGCGDAWTILHFSLSNPIGPGEGDVAKLLRRVADHVDTLGDIQIGDITFNSQPTSGEDDLTMTVYYHREPRRR